MGKQRHSRDSIMQTLQNVAARLGKTTLSKREVGSHLSLSAINYYFGNLGTALKEAGLSIATQDPSAIRKRLRIDDDVLFASLWEVEQKIGHPPNLSEYRANGGTFSNMPFTDRFGKWQSTLQHYHKWRVDRAGSSILNTGASMADEPNNGKCAEPPTLQPSSKPIQSGIQTRRAPQLYGEPIEFRGLRHAPINEQGVVYLFGMVSRELGFSVEALQQGFPDCEGKYLHDKNHKLWAKARIEFEFRASNFREHCHDENECDVIVCWENDWPDCPLRVVELKSEIMRLPSR
ncbi:MAG: homing endonuclease associated repeat-containing protein [Terriglobia bacterium]